MSKAGRPARDRLREEQRRQAERDRRRRRLLLVLAPVAVIVVVVVAAGLTVQAVRDRGSDFAGGLPAAAVLDDGSVRLAAPGTTVNTPVIDVYEDFQCPACREFERINSGTLQRLASEREAVVVYRPVAIIDQRSVRAGSAARCAADAGKYVAYHDVLFENQPPERGGQGFTAEDLKTYGEEVGLDGGEFASCVESVKYRDDLLQRTQRISAEYEKQTGNGFGTPTVYLNGKPLDINVLFSVEAFEEAVQNAPEPSPRSTATASHPPDSEEATR